ncbi:MAG: kdsA [Chlamydiales bacterium]|nr:kdsA [Chlamydiales bacterium]
MYTTRQIPVKNFFIGTGNPLAIIAGPCVIESESASLFAAEALQKMMSKHHLNFIFKSSYDKANRSAGSSFRGPGIQEGLRILEKVKKTFDIPVITDVHSPDDAKMAGGVCDIIQIPAFLCRQTDLILAAGETGAVVNVKKGQFLAPWDMKNVIDKLVSTGNHNIILTERGVSFGYNQLVTDMRSIPIMQKMGYPVCFDASHSVQKPGGLGHASGGEREFIPMLACSAVTAGCNSVFIESHPNPPEALSDRDSMISFTDLPKLLMKLERLHAIAQEDVQ